MKSKLLQIKTMFDKTFWYTLFLLILFVGILEWIVRLEVFQAALTPPKMGARHYQLGHKLALLDETIKEYGSIDCIMVGSSMVDVGFDPDIFRQAYQEVVGQDIRCFNFGIDASSAATTAVLVKILLEDYHPRLLIFGTDARDYVITEEDPDAAAILDSPWIQYRQGNFSMEGWLLDNSYFFRYRQHLSRLSRLTLEDTLVSHTELNFEILANGFTPLSKVSSYINSPPAPDDESYEVTYYTRIFSSFRLVENNFAALEQILNTDGSGTQVILVEMPVADGLYYFFGNGHADYDQFVARVDRLSNKHQTPFWRTEPLDSIPDDGWADYSHLNTTGAEIFSSWLGQQTGIAEQQGIVINQR